MKTPKTSRIFRFISAFVILLLSFSAIAAAQVSTGTITGRVTDPSGAPVPGVLVTITEQNTNVSVKTKTASNGNYSVPLLKPGVYSVTVEANGFQRAERTNLALQVQATLEADFQLQIGRVSQEVNVVSTGAPLIQTSSSEVGTVVGMQTTQELPLNAETFPSLRCLRQGLMAARWAAFARQAGAMKPSGPALRLSRMAAAGASMII